MTQPFVDWELVESKEMGTFKYEIMKVINSERIFAYRGYIFFKSGIPPQWMEDDSIDRLRLALINFGRQG